MLLSNHSATALRAKGRPWIVRFSRFAVGEVFRVQSIVINFDLTLDRAYNNHFQQSVVHFGECAKLILREGKNEMARVAKSILFGFLLKALSCSTMQAATWTAASCNTTDVQTAINTAAEGDTVLIPAGTCAWTSGVTISGKGITVQGAGSGRIIAYDNGTETPSIGTGTQTFTIAGYSPGFSAASIATGETLRVFENNARTNYMQGAVTSLSGNALTMNITSTGGGGSTHRWLVATIPSTVLVNNSSSTMFSVTEDSTIHINLGGFKIANGTGTGDAVDFVGGGGAAIVLQNCWIEQTGDISVHSAVNRGVISNCSFDSSPFSEAPIAIDPQPFDTTAWSTPSYWGALDTNGQHSLYVETNDFHAYLLASDNDEGARTVYRYNLFDNAGLGGHGADTGPFGARYFEFYNNTGVFNAYSDGSTFPMNQWYYVRGGTFVVFNNTLPALVSQDYGTKDDLNMTVMNLQRNAGPNPCWGQGTSGGADYYAPHQVGLGYVTGTGVDGLKASTYSAAGYGYSSTVYVGDSEPGYIWGNSRVPLGNTGVSDYGTGNSGSCTGTLDTSANYIEVNRDYFNGSTAKPGYSPYTYPHPLTQATNPPPAPTVPAVVTNIQVMVH